ncbi:hypothetical protein SEPL_059 [Salmonella phage SE_PL]|uniref:hypothetical protein n=1 Tax=Salmonella enterica TaxID=28901 RepID=UPI000FDF6E2E|nr:hypothetical protein CPT_Munch_368 [Salmonella phage Munch]EAZ2022662.1 hypothetical protein [Salmonella enterica]ECV9083796.1 hypothetical protein [Salmonella enterica subsp. enterica serovar Infantis]QCW19066.1 hypothetical protein 7t3_0546 [Salmonella phage 7t3]QIG62672.1 hypothetical protein SEPL_059 [Salmonella phage SE_PL]
MKINFETWMDCTYKAIQLVQDIGRDVFYHNPFYKSPYISFERIDGRRFITITRELTPEEKLKSENNTLLSGSSGYNIVSMSSSNAVTLPPLITIKLVIDCQWKIQSIQWIQKTGRGLAIIGTYSGEYDSWKMSDSGGEIVNSILFIEKGIVLDGKVYTDDNPEAFMNDISTDEVRCLDLLHMREKYKEPLFGTD